MRMQKIVVLMGSLALAGVAPALADSQLAASAGLTADQAAGMTLTEIAQHKFNRDESASDRSNPPVPGAKGNGDYRRLAATTGVTPGVAAGMSLTELAAVKFNNEASRDDRQTVTRQTTVVVATRSARDMSGTLAQLIASARLTPSEAVGMSLTEIARRKFDQDGSNDDEETASAK